MKNISHKAAHKAIQAAGWVKSSGGKGSHIKFKKPGAPMIILSSHDKNIDPKAAKELVKLGII